MSYYYIIYIVIADIVLPSWAIPIAVSLVGGGGIFYLIFSFALNKKQYNAGVNSTEADAVKKLADAYKAKAEGETLYTAHALKWAEKLSEECEAAKKELEKSELEMKQVRELLKAANDRIDTLEKSLMKERQINEELQRKISELEAELHKKQDDYKNKKS